MKLAFISGPYRGPTESDVVRNIRHAEKYAIQYWLKGFAVICPHKNTALLGGLAPEKVWLEGDMEILRRCDLIVMIPGWENSEGAKAEHEAAVSMGMDIIYEKGD